MVKALGKWSTERFGRDVSVTTLVGFPFNHRSADVGMTVNPLIPPDKTPPVFGQKKLSTSVRREVRVPRYPFFGTLLKLATTARVTSE